MWRCPKCGSSQLEQYRMPYGPMWCKDCFFRIEEKNVTPNPFYVEEENQVGLDREESGQSGMGEQLAAWQKMKRKKKQ
jgi:hypothetical protein